MKARVTKKIADKFLIGSELLSARGGLKENGIFVGDIVLVDTKQKVIEKVFERKNLLVRPPLANLDRMIIVIAKTPKPDFLLVDKLIIFCKINGILPILCVNKSDLLEKEQKNLILTAYERVLPIIFVSAKEGEVKDLKGQVKGVCALAGQSAVGKSSLINCLLGSEIEKVGDLAKKVERGKQTTRVVSLYEISKNNFLADTAGFSKIDLTQTGLDERELIDFYDDFQPFLSCKFSSCTHTNEKECQIKLAANEEKISKQRYQSYVKIFEELKSGRRK